MPITKVMRVAEPVDVMAGKNAIINGGFDIWQRGTGTTTITANNASYTADRWQGRIGGGVGGSGAFSRQVTGDTTNLPNIQYCMRVQRPNGNTATNVIYADNMFETVNSIPMAGKTVTLSFYARRGANYSGSLLAQLRTGTGTDQNLYTTGYTGAVVAINSAITMTTTWQRFTITATLDATATEIAITFEYTPTGTAGAADFFEITGVQLELGSVATPFARTGGTIQGELAACQRYYYRIRGDEGNNGTTNAIGLGTYYSSTTYRCPIKHPVKMRAVPTYGSSNTTNAFTIYANSGGTNYSTTTLDFASQDSVSINVTVSGATGGQSGWLQTNAAATYIELIAEL